MSEFLDRLRQSSAYFGANAPFIEDLLNPTDNDPASVPGQLARTLRQPAASQWHPVNDLSHRRAGGLPAPGRRPTLARPRTVGLSALAAERQAKVLGA